MEEKAEKQSLLWVWGKGDDGRGGGGATFVLILSVLVAVCGSLAVGCSIGYSSPVQSEVMADLGLSIADAFGLSSSFFLTGWLVIAFSQGVWTLALGRMLTGYAAALTTYVVPVYIAEITPKNLRGGFMLLHQLMLSSGIALSFIAGIVTPWRILAIIGAVPCMIQLLGLLFIPESPRWLVGCDRKYEAILQRLRGKNTDISLEASEIKEYIAAAENISDAGILDIFQRKYASALVITLGLVILSPLTGTNGILFYASSTFESAGVSSTLGTVTMSLIQLPPIFLGMFLMDNYGRRPILLCSISGMCLACLSVAVSFLMKEHGLMTEYSPYLALIGILVYSAVEPVGLGGTSFIIMSELFPMNVKGAAGSLAATVGGCNGWLVSFAFNFMMEWSSSGTFFIFTSVCITTLVFVYKLVPETKGRTLEEIHESLTHTLH